MASVLAAQLYTLRDFTRTPADIARTMKRVKEIGYDAVQCSALGPIEPAELAKILKGEGLTCCATHVPFDRARDEPEKLADEHRVIGCKYPALGSMPGADYPRTLDGFTRFAKDLGAVSRRLKELGLVFGYHNHSFEFEKYDNGKTGMDVLFEQSDPSLTFEVDTYWVQHGGADPAAWVRKFAGRIPLVHLKDMVVGEDMTAGIPLRYPGEADEDYEKRAAKAREKRPIMAEIGEGNMNWSTILPACRDAGVEWYIVEQDTCQRDPFESLAISLRNLKGMGVR